MARILYVDDEAGLRRVIKRLRMDYEVDVAADADEARRYIDSHQYSFLVVDYMLGDVLGTELLVEIAPRQPDAGLVVVSGYVVDDQKLEIAGRPVYVIRKPWTREILLDTFRQLTAG